MEQGVYLISTQRGDGETFCIFPCTVSSSNPKSTLLLLQQVQNLTPQMHAKTWKFCLSDYCLGTYKAKNYKRYPYCF